MAAPLLQVTDLRTEFRTSAGVVQAVRGVTFSVRRGEVVGIVGESGSGKSVTALSILRLVPQPPARIVDGVVLFDELDLLRLSAREMQRVRGGRISMVFQDPFSSLNPTMTLGAQVAEAIRAHAPVSARAARDQAADLFRAVRIPSPEMRLRQYPHQVSGGQRQRAMIAMAFAAKPDLLIADEPTTALDVTVQAQIMTMMADFQKRTNAAILLITHDLAVVAEMCDRVLVMYAGQIVEEAPTQTLFAAPRHPYTVGLLASLPSIGGERAERLAAVPGQPPDLAALPPGCPFAPRCPHATDRCRTAEPGRTDVAPGQSVRCVLFEPAAEARPS